MLLFMVNKVFCVKSTLDLSCLALQPNSIESISFAFAIAIKIQKSRRNLQSKFSKITFLTDHYKPRSVQNLQYIYVHIH